MNVPCRMELWHEQRVRVPEVCFHQWPVKFLKAKCHQTIFDVFEEICVGIRSAGDDAGRGNVNVVAA